MVNPGDIIKSYRRGAWHVWFLNVEKPRRTKNEIEKKLFFSDLSISKIIYLK